LSNREYRQIAVEAAKEGANILLKYFGSKIEIRRKGKINLVTEVDMRSEERIIEVVRSYFPDHQILAEEGQYAAKRSPYKWIIDPLDGTTNYAHGYPCFSVSIGLEVEGEVVLGVVYQPLLDELFIAEKGNGATLNQRKISVSQTEALDSSLLGTGFPYDVHTNRENNLNYFNRFALNAQAIRRDGSAAIDLCYVAAGRFDGYWELRLSAWDVAAGSLIVTEAGGRVTDFKGNKCNIYGEQVAASNGRIHDQMLSILQG
jgi:myo-inositol-1(or 4)-monophosphatase